MNGTSDCYGSEPAAIVGAVKHPSHTPSRGGWEAIQPMLGDETEADCGAWMWSDSVVAVLLVVTLALIFVGVI